MHKPNIDGPSRMFPVPRQRMHEIVSTRVRYGYRRVHVMLRRAGWSVGRPCANANPPPAHTATTASSAAVRSAVEIQRDVSRRDWGAIGELRIRVGLHTGECDVSDGDVSGIAVHAAARIQAAAGAPFKRNIKPNRCLVSAIAPVRAGAAAHLVH